MDIEDLIESFATGRYAVTRREKAIFVAGRPTPGATSMLTITASVQPASGQDLRRLPEGRQTIETRTLYTIERLLAGGQGAAFEPDLVQIGVDAWEIQHVEQWLDSSTGGVGYRCIAQKPAVTS